MSTNPQNRGHYVNILLMVSDDHGREALGCYGNTVIQTPNLDALASDGVRFTNAFCTTASCAASRSVILSGLYNHRNGTYGHIHGYHHFASFDDVVTLPKSLNEAGYRTACIGKKHFAPAAVYPFGEELGDSVYGRDDVAMSEACGEFIAASEEPFFLYWCSHNPHRDGRILKNHPNKPDRFGNPDSSFPGDEETPYTDTDVVVPPFLSDTPAARAETAQYYQSISRLDRGVGRILSILKETGKYENTLIIYISDNGAAFPASKTTLYEPGMNLPCIVRSPLPVSRGTTCDGLITWADLTPTILDMAGADDISGSFHGRSFASIVDDPSPANWRDEIYASHCFHEITNYYPMRVVRTKRYKFIWNIAYPLTYSFASDLWASATWQEALASEQPLLGRRSVKDYLHHPQFELYDLQNDPYEINNLSGKAENAYLVEEFCDKLKAFQRATEDPWLHKWDYE